MEFVFDFEPSHRVPSYYVYMKPKRYDVGVAYANGLLAQKLFAPFMNAGPQETLLYLQPNQVERLGRAALVITELDDGTAEWRLELRRHELLPKDPGMSDSYYVSHGYVDSQVVFAEGVNHRSFAQQVASGQLSLNRLRK